MFFESLIIKHTEPFWLYNINCSRFLDLKRSLTMSWRLLPIKSSRIFLEYTALRTNRLSIEISSIKFCCISLEKCWLNIGYFLIWGTSDRCSSHGSLKGLRLLKFTWQLSQNLLWLHITPSLRVRKFKYHALGLSRDCLGSVLRGSWIFFP